MGAMTDLAIHGDLLALLKTVDTPTVCNAIEVAQGKRGFARFTRETMVCSDPSGGAIVGYARTARIAGAEPPSEPVDVIRERRMAYYRHMADGPRPAIAVVEDVDRPDLSGAWWGEVNATIHKGLGMAGALTNGLVRDLGDLPNGFPVIAGSIGPSHAHVYVRDFAEPVKVKGLAISNCDLVHADRHGAVVIPTEILPELEDAIRHLLATEKLVLEPARAEGFDMAALETAWSAFEKART